MSDSSGPRDRDSGANTGDVRHPSPKPAASAPVDSASQDQVRADHDALQESARRVEASVPASVRETPVQPAASAGSGADQVRNADPAKAAVDRVAAARQDQVRADHDALEESARRVESSVPADVRDNPVRHSGETSRSSDDNTQATRDSKTARENADAARESMKK